LVEGCNLVTDEDDENTPMTSNADLRIDKTSSVDDIGPGGSFNWILDVTNNGPGAAINVVVADTLPDTVTVTSVSSAEFFCSFVGNEVTCTRASMASGSAGRVTIAVMVKASTAAGTTENLGRVESDTPDPDRTNNSDTDPVNIVVSQPPAVTLPPPPPVEPPLPQTGGDIAGTVTTALWLLLAGGALIVITRRRKRGAAAS